jgi:hypothetical protein
MSPLLAQSGHANQIDDRLLSGEERVPKSNGGSMTAAESKSLQKGTRVCWRGDANDGGKITETRWDAVTTAWDNGQVATVHHGDMREVHRARGKPIIV